eukprot:5377483-Pleurochrysis_carterae.AAC.1
MRTRPDPVKSGRDAAFFTCEWLRGRWTHQAVFLVIIIRLRAVVRKDGAIADIVGRGLAALCKVVVVDVAGQVVRITRTRWTVDDHCPLFYLLSPPREHFVLFRCWSLRI